jgi:hypothetical protein
MKIEQNFFAFESQNVPRSYPNVNDPLTSLRYIYEVRFGNNKIYTSFTSVLTSQNQMMDEDGFGGSGLREEQLITSEEMDSIIREVPFA